MSNPLKQGHVTFSILRTRHDSCMSVVLSVTSFWCVTLHMDSNDQQVTGTYFISVWCWKSTSLRL